MIAACGAYANDRRPRARCLACEGIGCRCCEGRGLHEIRESTSHERTSSAMTRARYDEAAASIFNRRPRR